METGTIRIYPATMGVAAVAYNLAGPRVDPGSWMTPVFIHDATPDEVDIVKLYFPDLNVVFDPGPARG